MAIQRITTKLEKVRVSVPPYMESAIPVLYLGMPPLPLTYNSPLKGVKNAITTISGLGDGGFKLGTKPQSTGVRNKIDFQPNKTTGTKTKKHNSKSSIRRPKPISAVLSKKKSSKKGVLRIIKQKNGRKVYMKNGKFVKSGGK